MGSHGKFGLKIKLGHVLNYSSGFQRICICWLETGNIWVEYILIDQGLSWFSDSQVYVHQALLNV